MARGITYRLTDPYGTERPAFEVVAELVGLPVEQEFVCPKHGGEWGDDETCTGCTDEDGNPLPYLELDFDTASFRMR